jgi:hypothetical protein
MALPRERVAYPCNGKLVKQGIHGKEIESSSLLAFGLRLIPWPWLLSDLSKPQFNVLYIISYSIYRAGAAGPDCLTKEKEKIPDIRVISNKIFSISPSFNIQT